MTKFRCWMSDYHAGEDGADEIESVMEGYPEYVAKEACEYWESHGVWSGDPIPEDIEVHVRNTETGELFRTSVNAEYEVVFRGGSFEKVVE